MEIYSLRSSYYNNYKNNTKNNKSPGIDIETANPVFASAQTAEQNASNLDFSSMTPRTLREIARVRMEDGLIDQETFASLSAGLPMQAIDVSGRILDLSAVTDETAFDFRSYYAAQLNIALSLGDSQAAQTLKSVVSFIDGGPA